MLKRRKEELQKLIDLELGKARLSTEKTSSDVTSFNKYSPSQSGDRYHSESAAELAKEFLSNLSKFREEVNNTSEQISSSAQPVSYVEIGYNTGERAKFYLVNVGALLPGILLITRNSPIGKAIYGKRVGDKFNYKVERGEKSVSYSGKIEKIE